MKNETEKEKLNKKATMKNETEKENPNKKATMENETEKGNINKKATMKNETEKENLNKKAMKSKTKSTKVDISRKWYFAFVTVSIIWRVFIHGHGVQTEAFKQQKKKGASLIIANHLTAFDFIYYAPNFVGRKTNMVVAENMKFSRPIFAKLMDGYHVITKKQNFADFQCIKNIKRYLDAGISVFICPEGKVSAEGRTGLIGDSIARLIQWLGYPVTTVINSGSGLMRPKWAYNNRKVRVTTNCDVLFTAEQTKTLSKAEIYQKVKCALDHNEHEYQAQNKIVVHGKRYAEGLERLLYKCPKCGAEFAMKTSNDKLFCEACGNAVRYMPTGELVPIGNDDVSMGRIDYWCDMERGEVAEEVEKQDFCISNRVDLFKENETKNGYKYLSSGIVTLNRDTLNYDTTQKTRPIDVPAEYKIGGSIDVSMPETNQATEAVEDEFKHLSFNVKNFVTVANIPGDSIDLYDDKHIYRLLFTDKKASTKYTFAIENINENCAISR